MCSNMDERLSDELESLQAILMDEVIVTTDGTGGADVEISVLPSTAADRSSQYVRVTLMVRLPSGYPDIAPIVSIKNPRGLDETVVKLMETEIRDKIDAMTGEPLVFELIEVARDHLTESNVPSCQCAICLYGFDQNDQFVKTSCYHYFHSHCLSQHVLFSERRFKEEQEKLPAWQRTDTFQRLCPVCREPIDVNMEALTSAAPPVERETARIFELNDEMKLLQQQMAKLYQHQQSRGGIIDPEAEDSKLVLVTEPVEETTEPGPSDPREREDRRAAESRRGAVRGRGGQHRGAFAAARKNRGHLFTASR